MTKAGEALNEGCCRSGSPASGLVINKLNRRTELGRRIDAVWFGSCLHSWFQLIDMSLLYSFGFLTCL